MQFSHSTSHAYSMLIRAELSSSLPSSLFVVVVVISLRIVLPHIKGCFRMEEDAKREEGRGEPRRPSKEREGRVWENLTKQIKSNGKDTVDCNSKCNRQMEKVRSFEIPIYKTEQKFLSSEQKLGLKNFFQPWNRISKNDLNRFRDNRRIEAEGSNSKSRSVHSSIQTGQSNHVCLGDQGKAHSSNHSQGIACKLRV